MYRVKEIFYSLQGEGFWTGTPAVFVRLSGCNLRCPFCDTDFAGGRELSLGDLVAEVGRLSPAPSSGASPIVVLTGGEPSLQADRALVDALHEAGFRIHIETNGTHALPEGIDWVTLSPKASPVVLEQADELKRVFRAGDDPAVWLDFPARWHFLQPCDEPADPAASLRNRDAAVAYILAHPAWRLSLQTHKILSIR